MSHNLRQLALLLYTQQAQGPGYSETNYLNLSSPAGEAPGQCRLLSSRDSRQNKASTALQR